MARLTTGSLWADLRDLSAPVPHDCDDYADGDCLRCLYRATTFRAIRGTIYRAIRRETAALAPHSLGALLVASGAVS